MYHTRKLKQRYYIVQDTPKGWGVFHRAESKHRYTLVAVYSTREAAELDAEYLTTIYLKKRA